MLWDELGESIRTEYEDTFEELEFDRLLADSSMALDSYVYVTLNRSCTDRYVVDIFCSPQIPTLQTLKVQLQARVNSKSP